MHHRGVIDLIGVTEPINCDCNPTMPLYGKREMNGKKVEFSPTLSPIDSSHTAHPHSPAHPGHGIAWDTETDHMLSYFLGGENVGGLGPIPDFSAPGNGHMPGPEELSEDEDAAAPPPTPAVQHFYSSGIYKDRSGVHHQATSTSAYMTLTSNSSSSSNSLPNMAIALVSGGPMVQHQLQHQQMHLSKSRSKDSSASLTTVDSFTHENPSPLSPTVHFMAAEQENLLLPGTSSTTPSPACAGALPFQPASNNPLVPDQTARHQQHIAWLNDLNARAKVATSSNHHGHFTTAVHAGAPHHQASHQQHHVPPHVPPVTMSVSSAAAIMGYYPNPHLLPHHPHANPYLFVAAAQTMTQTQGEAKDPAESEEKRVKRLERNRESARKSRRKKKERLSTLEAQVNKLHQEIEEQRHHHISTMVDHLKVWRKEELRRQIEAAPSGEDLSEKIASIIRFSGPNSSVSRSVSAYQYNHLRQLTLPGYQKFLLWCVLRDDAFFMAAKEDYARRESSAGGPTRSALNKVSSKQIGEELFSAGTQVDSEESDDAAANARAAGQYASCFADDALKTWPLFCSELKFSVDQEEKFLAQRRKSRELPDLMNVHSQMNAAVQTVESLRNAIGSVSRAVAQRETKAFASILLPQQAVTFQNWLASNRETCLAAVSSRRSESPLVSSSKDASLYDICRRLNEVLRISQAQ